MNANCARCGRDFTRRRSDHRFCSPICRKLGERAPWEPPAADPEAVDRLFDESRDPDAICLADDWYPGGQMPESEQRIYLIVGGDSVASRRRLFARHHPTSRSGVATLPPAA